MTVPAEVSRSVTAQGHYAGFASRFVAFVVDAAASCAVFALALAALSYAVTLTTGRAVSWNRQDVAVAAAFAVWELFYFGYSWAAGGRSLGMAVLGLRVMRADGRPIDPRRGVLRALAFPLSFLFCGLGFLGILTGRQHRALHDVIAGTAVVYEWDARAARLRFLAHERRSP